jgi:hypothetical protein
VSDDREAARHGLYKRQRRGLVHGKMEKDVGGTIESRHAARRYRNSREPTGQEPSRIRFNRLPQRTVTSDHEMGIRDLADRFNSCSNPF